MKISLLDMKNLMLTIAVLSSAALLPAAAGWIRMFDGKTLEGWKADANPDAWSVRDGALVGDGAKSYLFWIVRECDDCEFKAEVKISDGGNSGMFFRKGFGTGVGKGYEAQINSTHMDPIKTGSLYRFKDVYEHLIPPDTWFTQHIIARGNHIIIKVNDKTVVDYRDEKNTFVKGHLALQQHNKGSVVSFKNLMMRPLK